MGSVSVEFCGAAEAEECHNMGAAEAEEPGGAGAVSMVLCRVAKAEKCHGTVERRQRSGAGAVSMKLRGVAEAKEHCRAWETEDEEPHEVGAVSVELREAGAPEVEE